MIVLIAPRIVFALLAWPTVPQPPQLHHYVFFNRSHARIADTAFLNHPTFEGAQLKYTWRELEPRRGEYDFAIIRRDLDFLSKHGKKLFIQLQDVSFDSTIVNVPDYVAKSRSEAGWVARRWDPSVQREFSNLLHALGAEFDGKIEGINLPETSLAIETDPSTYRDAVITNMTALRDAFRKSTVMQYANFMAGEWLPEDNKHLLESVYAAADRLGVSVGGPDLLPGRPGQMKHSYKLIPLNTRTRNGIAVQEGNYEHVDPRTGHVVTVDELLDFAANRLKVHYVFWYPEEPYFTRDVAPRLRSLAN